MDEREDLPVIDFSDSTKVEGLHAEEKKPPPRPAPPRTPPETRRAAVPTPRPAASAPVAGEEDPEKLLQQYAERQKNRIARLEQDLQKTAGERDALQARADTLSRELTDSRQRIVKLEESVRDLQQKLDAAVLSNGMLQTELSKVKARVHDLEGNLRQTEERAAQAEKSLAEAQLAVRQQTQARQEAEAKIAAALQALQGKTGQTSHK